MRIVIDSASYASISGYRWPYKIGYVNGSRYAWSTAQIADARGRGELLALIDVTGAAPRQASILDWERGDVQDATTLRNWVRERNAIAGDAAVYCNRSSLHDVLDALAGMPFHLWLAAPTAGSEPPMTPPDLGLPHNVRLLGIQYVFGPRSGGNYDMSIFYDDAWHKPAPGSPEAHAAAAAAAMPTGLPAAARIADALAASPDPSLYPGHSAPPDTSAESPGFSTGSPRPVPASALSTSSATASAPSSEASPGARIPPYMEPGSIAAAAPPWPPATAPDPVQPPTADVSRETSTAPDQLPHQWISRVLHDLDNVAGLFRHAGAGSTADLLEQTAEHATEVGQLLQKAGL